MCGAQTSLVSSSMSASRSSTGNSEPGDAGGRYVIDTSIWIPVLRPGRLSQELGPRLAALVTSVAAVTTDVVVMEPRRGARNVTEYQRLEAQLTALPLLPVTAERWREAARLGFDLLRQHGLIVATPDLLIAAVAIAHRVTIIHRDADFDLVAQHTPLHVESHI